MIECSEARWYDVTSIDDGAKGQSRERCVAPGCLKVDCPRERTLAGGPRYDPHGETARALDRMRRSRV